MNGVSGYQAIWWPLTETDHWYLDLGFPLVKVEVAELVERFSLSWPDWGPTYRISVVERDLSGVPYRSVPALGGLNGQFATGQKGYQVRRVQAQLIQWYVKKAYRGTSAAPRLVKAFVAWARTRGANDVFMGISSGLNVHLTHRLMRRLGFSYLGGNYGVQLNPSREVPHAA